MIDPKLLEIFSITVPVFSLAGLGKLLSHRKILNNSNKKPLSWITYYLALPALILSSFFSKNETEIEIVPLLTISVLVIILMIALVAILTLLFARQSSKEKNYAATYTSYWGNNGYMGFPLAVSALASATVPESAVMNLAAVVNGVSVPFYIGISLFMMYHAKGSGSQKEKIKDEFLHTLFSPVIMAMILGAILSSLRPHIPLIIKESVVIQTVFETFQSILSHLGHMGLPLALLLVGSNLNFAEVKSDKRLLAFSIAGKLLVAPAIVYFLAPVIFPNMSTLTFQALILLNAVPGAVASFIISEKFECAEEFVSSALVLSTLFSIITIPIWLHIIL